MCDDRIVWVWNVVLVWNVELVGKGVGVLWMCVSVLRWGGRVQEFGSDAYRCINVKMPYQNVFMISYEIVLRWWYTLCYYSFRHSTFS